MYIEYNTNAMRIFKKSSCSIQTRRLKNIFYVTIMRLGLARGSIQRILRVHVILLLLHYLEHSN